MSPDSTIGRENLKKKDTIKFQNVSNQPGLQRQVATRPQGYQIVPLKNESRFKTNLILSLNEPLTDSIFPETTSGT